jgi:hypothetical protein
MEQRKAVHFEIQCENSNGQWAELLQERPKTEEEIRDLCDRARAIHPLENIRAVKVTTTVTVEQISPEPQSGNSPRDVKERELHLHNRIHELLQDCD